MTMSKRKMTVMKCPYKEKKPDCEHGQEHISSRCNDCECYHIYVAENYPEDGGR